MKCPGIMKLGLLHEAETKTVKARSHGTAAVPQGFWPQPLPHRIGLEPVYLRHLAAPLLQPLPLPHSMNTHIGSNAFHFFAAAAAAPCEWTFTTRDEPKFVSFAHKSFQELAAAFYIRRRLQSTNDIQVRLSHYQGFSESVFTHFSFLF